MTATQLPVIHRLDEDQERLLDLVEGQAVTQTDEGDNVAYLDLEVRAALLAGHVALVPDPARRVWQLTPAGVRALQESRFARHVEAAAGLPPEVLYAVEVDMDMDQPCADVDPEPQVSYDTTRWTTVAYTLAGLIALIAVTLIAVETQGEVSATLGATGVGVAFLAGIGMVAALGMDQRAGRSTEWDMQADQDLDIAGQRL
ncbi:hypothetical protein GCM10027280_45130 [Micromonospora polyrhachis]|uniref:Uncharacterized protein n=1 Tax=Micromonospora polyrhachis TaxID=1282883 RepID=A0A7W7SQB1_9ACTN|nr:hypothetical protein [Micromonospora polyrhachis]MBB4958973.1 hypothetical protein [Micromonospora polyrhachis]